MSGLLQGKAYYAPLPAHLKLALLALCDEADDQGRGVFIGQERLAFKVGAAERTVRGNLAKLREMGYVQRLPDRHPRYGTDQYEVVVEMLPTDREIRAADVAGRERQMLPVGPEGPATDRQADRQPTAASTGNGSPLTRESPVSKNTREIVSLAFEAFWKVYPIHVGRKAARSKFEAAVDRGVDPAEIVEGARRHADDPNRRIEYTKHPTTWLNQGCWEDDPLPPRADGNGRRGGVVLSADRLEARRAARTAR